MSNLTPTPRTDKNGRTVIRHMKPQTTTKSNTMIPPVSSPALQSRDARITAAVRKIDQAIAAPGAPEPHPRVFEKITRALNTYSDATIERVQQHSWGPATAVHFNVGVMNTWDETQANDYMMVSNALTEEAPDGIPPFHYDSWKHYPELHPANNDGDYPEERLAQLIAIYRVIEDMEEQGYEPYRMNELTSDADSYFLSNDQLRNLICNPGHPHTPEEVARIITTHHVYDPERIKSMLDLENPSMSSGVL